MSFPSYLAATVDEIMARGWDRPTAETSAWIGHFPQARYARCTTRPGRAGRIFLVPSIHAEIVINEAIFGVLFWTRWAAFYRETGERARAAGALNYASLNWRKLRFYLQVEGRAR